MFFLFVFFKHIVMVTIFRHSVIFRINMLLFLICSSHLCPFIVVLETVSGTVLGYLYELGPECSNPNI